MFVGEPHARASNSEVFLGIILTLLSISPTLPVKDGSCSGSLMLSSSPLGDGGHLPGLGDRGNAESPASSTMSSESVSTDSGENGNSGMVGSLDDDFTGTKHSYSCVVGSHFGLPLLVH